MILTGKSIFFFSAFLITLYSGRGKNDFFSPIRLYFLTFSFTLAIACLDLSPYSTDWSPVTWLVIALSTGAYCCGALGLYFISSSKGQVFISISEIKNRLVSSYSQIDSKKFLIASLLCWGVFLFVSTWGAHLIGGFTIFSDNPDKAKVDFAKSSSLTNFTVLGEAAFLLSFSFIMLGVKKLRTIHSVIIVTVPLMFLFLLLRLNLLRMLFMSLLLYRYLRGRFSYKAVVSIMVISITIIMGIFVLRLKGEYFNKKTFDRFASVRIKKGYEAIALPYAYVANNYWNLNYGIEQAGNGKFKPTYGFRTFNAIFQGLHVHKFIEKRFGLANFLQLEVQKTPGFNTITYHWNFYRDFGFLGVILGSFVFGCVEAYYYIKLRVQPSVQNLLLYSFFSYFTVMSFFAPMWYQLPVWIIIGAVYLSVKFALNK